LIFGRKPEMETLRPISSGAEKWLGEKIPVLDHGFVYLVDYMGSDQSIEQAARVSYGAGTRSVNETTGLIRYLMRHQHTTPFEMVEFKFHAKMPIFVARQWVRHRTASINEESARYSILSNEFYVPAPDAIAAQASTNRQGRGEVFDPDQAEKIRQLLVGDAVINYEHYEYMLNDDGSGKPKDESRDMLARELARMDLTLNFYTQWYWKANLHNTLRFLGLRMDPHAQYEIRVYADAMANIVKDAVPITWKAFEDYQLKSVKLNGPEIRVLALAFESLGITLSQEMIKELAKSQGLTNKRELSETMGKLEKLGLIK